jgi:hypothetical protein
LLIAPKSLYSRLKIARFVTLNLPTMKKTYLLLCILGLLAVVACKKDPDPIDPNPSVPETGVAFTCKDTIGLQDILVGIAPQAADRDNGVFLKSGLTDAFGKISFVSLDPQTFYYSASRTTTSGVIKRFGSVLVEQDKKVFVTVQF